MVVASSLVLVVGLVAWLSLRQSEAQGQVGQDKHGWEYKVVTFRVEAGDDKQTKEINSLAADGWEYVGLLCAGANPYVIRTGGGRGGDRGGGDQITSCGHVLFKRAKR
jgi:hypothetical protein